MKNSTKILIGIVVVALVGAGVYFGNTKLQKGSLGSLSSPSFNFVWELPANLTLLTGSQVEVARFHIYAVRTIDGPKAYVTVPQLNFYNLSTATLTNFTLNDITQAANVATNSNSGNFYNMQNGGTMKPLTFLQGESRTFKILADVGTNAGNQTAQFKYKDSLSPVLTAASIGTDTTPPSILSVALSNGGVANELDAGDTITIYFSEKIDSYPLNTVYGGSITITPTANLAGGINVDGNGDIIVANIVTIIDPGLSKAPTSVSVLNSLNSPGTILTITVKETNGTKNIIKSARKGFPQQLLGLRDTAGNKMNNVTAPSPTGSL